MTTDNPEDSSPEITPEDFAAAEAVLSQSPDAPKPGTAEYIERRQKYADCRARFGADDFDVKHGLREPRSVYERLLLQSHRERWSLEQFGQRLQALAERPVDADMVKEFFEIQDERLDAYGCLVRAVFEAAAARGDPSTYRAAMHGAEMAAERLESVPQQFSEEHANMLGFLNSQRPDRPKPFTLGEIAGTSASHVLVKSAKMVVERWRERRLAGSAPKEQDIYLLVKQEHLPYPRDLTAALQSERSIAEQAIAQQSPAAQPKSPRKPKRRGERLVNIEKVLKELKQRQRDRLGQIQQSLDMGQGIPSFPATTLTEVGEAVGLMPHTMTRIMDDDSGKAAKRLFDLINDPQQLWQMRTWRR